MITIISSTNRPNSHTKKLSEQYAKILNEHGVECQIFSLEELPHTVAFTELYGNRSEGFNQQIEKYIVNADKIVFIAPEYNGGFPGILKVFLDAVTPKTWWEKKVALVGVAAGRAGNLRGIDLLTLILQYLRCNVYGIKIPVSLIDKQYTENGDLNEDTRAVLTLQIQGFLKF